MMATRNHGNRLLIAIEQNDFFLFSYLSCLHFQTIFKEKLL